ncbi:MAG: DUF6686 family protein, partial [Bacteroidota bacterium]
LHLAHFWLTTTQAFASVVVSFLAPKATISVNYPSYPSNSDTFDRLYQQDSDRVVYCHECGLFHLSFGNFSLDLEIEELQTFKDQLIAYHDFHLQSGAKMNQRFEIQLDTPGFRLYLSLTEIRALCHMLSQAGAAFERSRLEHDY